MFRTDLPRTRNNFQNPANLFTHTKDLNTKQLIGFPFLDLLEANPESVISKLFEIAVASPVV